MTAFENDDMSAEELSEMADQIEVENDVYSLATAVSYVLKDCLDPTKAKFLEQNEGHLLASLASLQLICSELREVRIKKVA